MINCALLTFRNCDHYIKDSIQLSPSWFCSFNSIHALKKKWTTILLESNIEVIFFKQVHIIGWWTDTYSFMNGNIFILEHIADIQNPGRGYIQSCYSNIDSEIVSMLHWTIGAIKVNALNMIAPICTVGYN